MSKRLFLVFVLFLAGVGACKTAAPAVPTVDLDQIPTTFKATIKSTGGMNRIGVNMGEIVLTRKGDNFRTEPKGAPSGIVILNGEKKVMYYLIPAQKQYIEKAYDDKLKAQADLFKSFTSRPDLKIEPLGVETVAGHPCVKLKLTTTVEGKPTTTTLWCATDLKNLPIKIESDVAGGQPSVTELTDVSFDVDPAVFMPPADYKKLDAPGL